MCEEEEGGAVGGGRRGAKLPSRVANPVLPFAPACQPPLLQHSVRVVADEVVVDLVVPQCFLKHTDVKTQSLRSHRDESVVVCGWLTRPGSPDTVVSPQK